MNIVVADASPLIGLGRIGYLEILHQLYQTLLIPEQVENELQLSSSKPGSKAVLEAVHDGWIRCLPVHNTRKALILGRVVDAGEAEAIQLAIEQHADLLLIDDKKGRKIAQQRGVTITGTGGMLIAAKKSGVLQEVAPVLDALTRAKYRLSPALCDRILELAGEKK
ncbi:MAG: DUF3368 domain-containing protein [bacterium]|nr:DUF3368 domain-containing protein [bacterium]